MGTEDGRANSRLEELYQSGYKFCPFQAVRLLQKRFATRLEVGHFGRSTEEVIRFCGHNSLVFPAGIIRGVTQNIPPSLDLDNGGQVRLEVAVLGLAGYAGVLPLFYTELLSIEKLLRNKDLPLASFLDVFNHRLISLFYRCWERARPHIACERYGVRNPWNDFLSRHVFALMGIGTPALRVQSPVAPQELIRYAGLLPHKSSTSMESILEDRFGFSFQVEQFRGCWCKLDENDRAQLNRTDSDGQLGLGIMLGRATWYPQASFRISISALRKRAERFRYVSFTEPLGFKEFCSFLPGTLGFGRVQGMVNYFTSQRFEAFEIKLNLLTSEIPKLRTERFCRLGWTTWLGGRSDRNSVSVAFGTTEFVARVRVAIESMLKGLRVSVGRARHLDLSWNDAVVDYLVSSWKGPRNSINAYSKTVATKILDEICTSAEKTITEKRAVTRVAIQISEERMSYRVD